MRGSKWRMGMKARIEKLERALGPGSEDRDRLEALVRLYGATGADEPEKAAVDFVRRCRERGLHPSIMSTANLYRIPGNETGHSLSSRSMEAFA
jgi:hypothetical protein